MNRRHFLGATAAATTAAASAAPRRPNILLLHCHDLGQHLHCYGVDGVHSPHLDRLAGEGVLFENNFCTAPQCSPSRSSIFTGRYPHSNGVMGLTHADFAWDLHPGERHLGQILKAAGYTTSGAGVIHETRSGPNRCGFDDYTAASFAAAMADAVTGRLKALARSPQPFYIQAGCIEPHRLPPAEPNADQDFLGRHIQPDDSHGITIPPYLRDTPGTRREMAELQGAVRHMDSQIGRILTALDDLNLRDNTLVLFTTDHGIAMPRAKCSVYEAGLRTSLILRLPGRAGWTGGRRFPQLVSNIDYLPTILDAAGLAAPAGVQGRSFAALLDGKDYAPRPEVYGEMTYHDYYDPRRSVRTLTHKLIVNFTSAPAFMDPSQSWRPRADTLTPPNHALAYHPPYELYDLRADPWEQHDIAQDPAHSGVLQDLRARLLRHLESTADPILEGAVTGPLHRRSAAWLRG